jgi:hypothetical protein
MTDQLIALSILALDAGITADELGRKFAEDVLLDHLGRPALEVDLACKLIAEHRARRAAAAEAERERREREQAERQRAAEKEQALEEARQARAARQKQLLRDNPDLGAAELMRLSAGDDGGLESAGRRFDEFISAERNGHGGYGYLFNPQRKG